MVNCPTSVIVSSYNQPNTLRLVLAGLAAQDDLDFELIIADDGSDADTVELVRAFSKTAPFKVEFVTQEHKGFRKAQILNAAIRRASGAQWIFLDGDCIPFRNFVRLHKECLKPNSFCAAGYARIRLADARLQTPEGVAAGEHERFMTWQRRMMFRWIDLCSAIHQFFGRKDRPKVKGGNFSVDRASALAVDGFDEAYDNLGQSDSDMRNRLRNNGCRGVSVWRKIFVSHLDHGLDPRRCEKAALRKKVDPELYAAGKRRVKAVRGLSSGAKEPGTTEKH